MTSRGIPRPLARSPHQGAQDFHDLPLALTADGTRAYTHRIAISNARLVSLVDGVVQFRWKDYADRGHTKIMALDVDEFLRCFLLHVLPRGFVRIRHFGLLANRHRRATIAHVRQLLGQTAPTTSVADSPPADRDRV